MERKKVLKNWLSHYRSELVFLRFLLVLIALDQILISLGGSAISKILSDTMNDVKHEKLIDQKLKVLEDKLQNSNAGPKTSDPVGILAGSGAKPAPCGIYYAGSETPQDVIRVFMMKEFIGNRLLSDLITKKERQEPWGRGNWSLLICLLGVWSCIYDDCKFVTCKLVSRVWLAIFFSNCTICVHFPSSSMCNSPIFLLQIPTERAVNLISRPMEFLLRKTLVGSYERLILRSHACSVAICEIFKYTSTN